MDWCFQRALDCVNTYIPIVSAGGSIATAVALIFIIWTFKNNRKQLFISNFSEITSHIGDDDTKKYRGWFKYDNEKKRLLAEFIEKYDKDYYNKPIEERKKFVEIEKACRHLASRYDRVGVLLDNDERIREKFYDYHKEAILQAWDALKPLLNKRGGYKYFQKMGEEVEKKYKPRN